MSEVALVVSLACVGDQSATRRSVGSFSESSASGNPGIVALRTGGTEARGGLGVTAVVSSACHRDMLDAAMGASSTVRALTHENTSTIANVAQALDALAHAVRALGARDAIVDAALSRVNRDLVLLENCDELDPGAPGRARDGVLASIDAIRRGASAVHVDSADPWMDDARTAALAIDDKTMLVFQRVRVQEAFRSTADALLFVVRAASRCDALATNPAGGCSGPTVP